MLEIDVKELERTVKTAALGVAKHRARNPAPILECVRIDAAAGILTAEGYNRGEYVKASMRAGTNSHGLQAVIDAKALLAVLKGKRGTIELQAEGNVITVTAGSARHSLEGFDLQEFPEVPTIGAEWEAVIDGHQFDAALARVIPAASEDDARPGLESVLIEAHAGPTPSTGHLILVTADGFRLGHCRVPASVPSDHKIVIPVTAAKAIRGLVRAQGAGAVRLWIAGEYGPRKEGEKPQAALIECGDGSIRTDAIPWEFPDYLQILPKTYAFDAAVPKPEFLQAVKEAQDVSDDRPVRLHFMGNILRINAGTSVCAYSRDIPVTVKGPDGLLIGFNPGFLKDAIEAVEGDTMQFKASKATMPATLGSRECFTVVMPMYLGDEK